MILCGRMRVCMKFLENLLNGSRVWGEGSRSPYGLLVRKTVISINDFIIKVIVLP